MTEFPSVPTSSETTGPVSLGSAVANVIGQQRSGTLPANVLEPSQSLARLTPLDTDRRVADALQRISGRRPAFRRRSMFPENGPAYSITEAVSWTCEDASRRQALDAVEFSLRPAPEAMIAKALYELRTLTRGRVNRGADEDEAEAIIWTERLRQYPADIVLDTLLKWPSRTDGQWWPTWHDIHKLIDAATIGRKMLADHVRTGACLGKPSSSTAEVPPADDKEAWARRGEQAARAKERFAEPPSPMNRKMTQEEFDAWEIEFRAKGKAEPVKLSAEALRTCIPDPAEQYEAWLAEKEGRAA